MVYLLIIITFKVLGIVGRGFKSLLFSVKVYELLPEIQLSKLIWGYAILQLFRNLDLILNADIAYVPTRNYGLGLK